MGEQSPFVSLRMKASRGRQCMTSAIFLSTVPPPSLTFSSIYPFPPQEGANGATEGRGAKSARTTQRHNRLTFLNGVLAGVAAAMLLNSCGTRLTGASETLSSRQEDTNWFRGGAPPSPLCPKGVPNVASATTSHLKLLIDNLDPAFTYWESKEWGLPEIYATADALIPLYKDTVALIRIANNKLEFLGRDDDCTVFCNIVLEDMRDTLREGLESGRLRAPPNVTFIVNVNDLWRCPEVDGTDRCTAPLLSVISIPDAYDIPIPAFSPKFESHSVPWAAKRPMAFFRGTPYCWNVSPRHLLGNKTVTCSRYTMHDLTLSHPDILNATLTFDNRGKEPEGGFKEGPWVPLAEHPQYQMLLALDGFTASRRLGLLLAMNSVVLKQESRFIEHYYRSLRPCVHYLPIYKDNETDVLQVAEKVLADPVTAQAVSANAQAFALMHLNEDARLRYWEALLWRYAALANRGSSGGAAAAKRQL